MEAKPQTRLDRAKAINVPDVTITGERTCEVDSQSDPEKSYTVDLESASCTCPDHRYRETTCKHLYRCADLFGMIDLPDE